MAHDTQSAKILQKQDRNNTEHRTENSAQCYHDTEANPLICNTCLASTC